MTRRTRTRQRMCHLCKPQDAARTAASPAPALVCQTRRPACWVSDVDPKSQWPVDFRCFIFFVKFTGLASCMQFCKSGKGKVEPTKYKFLSNKVVLFKIECFPLRQILTRKSFSQAHLECEAAGGIFYLHLS